MKSKFALTLMLSGLVLVTILAGCGGGSSAPPPPPIQLPITVTILLVTGNPMVQAGGTVSITAQVTNDSSNKGVMWSVSCSLAPCGTVAPTSTPSGVPTTYTAPSTPPASDVQVTITATSVADPTQSAPLSIVFAAIQVLLSPSVNPVQAGGTSVITAMVNFDPANKGVDPTSWTISPTSGAGILSNQTSSSVTYTAPGSPPASDVPVTITATSISSPKQMGTIVITFAAIQVSLSANPISVQACPAQPCPNGTSTITATVSFDPANAGVNPASWAITSPASGGGALSNPTTTSVTYTAPTTPPPSDLLVTITATSASDSTKSGTTSVTVLAIVVTVSPASALIPVSTGSVQFIATVQNDPTASPQVNWTTVQNGTLCASGCGALSPTTTASGAATTYTPPSALPATPGVAVTATSATDATKSGSAAVTLTNGTVQLVPDSLNFGSVRLNFATTMNVALTNTGNSALSVNGITISGGPFTQTNTCGKSVAAAASCTISVTFKPTTRGTFNATLSIADSSIDSPQKVALSGSGFKFRFNAVKSALVMNKTVTAPTPAGPSPVGTRVLHLVDAARNDPFLADGTKRELLVRFWYPATQGQACKRAEYTSPKVWSHFSELLGIPLPQVSTNSCWNTSMTNGTHPVIVFTHGYTGTFTDYTFLFEDLASRGYVVASVDHTFEATAVEFPDGRFAESVLGSYLANDARSDMQTFEFALSVRLSDLKFVLNELERLNGGVDPLFTGKLDLSSIAVAGHSLGGLAALLGIEQESRFKTGILLDGAMPNSSFGGTVRPVLILAPGRDEWSDDERRLWGNLRGPRLAVNLRGGEHMTPSDAVWLANGAIMTGSMGTERTIAAIRSYVAAFLDANLLGKEPGPLLTGPSSEFPDATVTTRKELLRAKY